MCIRREDLWQTYKKEALKAPQAIARSAATLAMDL
jgi:hypothetical protein